MAQLFVVPDIGVEKTPPMPLDIICSKTNFHPHLSHEMDRPIGY